MEPFLVDTGVELSTAITQPYCVRRAMYDALCLGPTKNPPLCLTPRSSSQNLATAQPISVLSIQAPSAC